MASQRKKTPIFHKATSRVRDGHKMRPWLAHVQLEVLIEP